MVWWRCRAPSYRRFGGRYRGLVKRIGHQVTPWPFPLPEVTTPVHLWHDAADRNAPIAFARPLANALPDATSVTTAAFAADVSDDCLLWEARDGAPVQPSTELAEHASGLVTAAELETSGQLAGAAGELAVLDHGGAAPGTGNVGRIGSVRR
jgi:hypothetical protein